MLQENRGHDSEREKTERKKEKTKEDGRGGEGRKKKLETFAWHGSFLLTKFNVSRRDEARR